MPKIKVSGIDIKKYNENTSLEDFRDFILHEYEEPEISEEGLVSGALKATKMAIKTSAAVTKTSHGAIKTSAKMLSNSFNQVYPMMLKNFQNFGNVLSNMWARLLKYDKRFIALGKQIDEIIKYKALDGVSRMGKVTIKVHDVKWKNMKITMDLIRSWKGFVEKSVGYDVIRGTSGSTENSHGFRTVEDLKHALNGKSNREDRITIIDKFIQDNNSQLVYTTADRLLVTLMNNADPGMFNGNLGNALNTALRDVARFGGNALTLNPLKASGNLLKLAGDILKMPVGVVKGVAGNVTGTNLHSKVKNGINGPDSLPKLVELFLVQAPAYLKFDRNELDKFRAWCYGSFMSDLAPKWLSNCANLLSDKSGMSIVAQAIKTGGKSCKTDIDGTLKHIKKQMSDLIKIAEENDKKAEETNGPAGPTAGGGPATGKGGGSTVDFGDGEDGDERAKNVTSETHADADKSGTETEALMTFLNTYNTMLTNCTEVYKALVQGMLLATYTIVEDGESVVGVINTLRGASSTDTSKVEKMSVN